VLQCDHCCSVALCSPLKGVTVTVMSVATRGAMYRLLSVYVCSPSEPSTGAMVGSPLTPARLKAAFSGDCSTLCRSHHDRWSSAAAKEHAISMRMLLCAAFG
jgi:hypothetical protein